MEILLLIMLFAQAIAFILQVKLDKEREDLIEDILDFNKRLISERTNVIQIILDADTTKENEHVTLNKIKEELAVGKTY